MKTRTIQRGMTLPELLVTTALLAMLAGLSLGTATESLARQKVEGASRRLEQVLEEARAAAEQTHKPCAIALDQQHHSWTSGSGSGLPPCLNREETLSEGFLSDNDLVVIHNLPAQLRVSANGLVIDGGTVVIGAPGTELRRCLVVALPLGIVRVGRYSGEAQPPISSASCAADPTP